MHATYDLWCVINCRVDVPQAFFIMLASLVQVSVALRRRTAPSVALVGVCAARAHARHGTARLPEQVTATMWEGKLRSARRLRNVRSRVTTVCKRIRIHVNEQAELEY